MIHTCYFHGMSCGNKPGIPGWSEVPNHWKILYECLKHTEDYFIFVITSTQLPQFHHLIQKYDLGKFMVLSQAGEGQGTSNYRYLRDYGYDRRLRVFILKGKPQ